jgi:hypothetical protein
MDTTASLGFFRNSSTSDGGTWSMMSISPAYSAALREAPLVIAR